MQRCRGLSQASWNCILHCILKRGNPLKTLQLFRQMQREGVPPDGKTLAIALQACCKLLDSEDADSSLTHLDPLQIGVALHVDARHKRLASHPFVGSTILNLYGKCGCIAEAENVFTQLCSQDVVSWTTMLSAYAEHGHAQTALHMFKQMLEGGISPNKRTFVIAIQACCKLAEQEEGTFEHGRLINLCSLKIGQALHEDALRMNCADLYVGSALVSMYGKCGHIAKAEQVFYGLSQGDVVSWNAMLSAYVEQEEATKALQLFGIMQKGACVSPNNLTFVGVLQACCLIAAREQPIFVEGLMIKPIALEIGQSLHFDARTIGLASHAFVGSALVNMYSKCGSILEAETVFNGLSQPNIVSWNAMLSAYVDQEQGDKALSLYEQMLGEGVSLSDISIACILRACSETCCVEVCRQTHCAVVSRYSISTPLVSTLIHVYGSCASMEDAQAAFDSLYHADIVPWNALCGGHAREGDHIATLRAFNEMQLTELKPDDVSYLSVLSVCNHCGLIGLGTKYLEIVIRQSGKNVNPKHLVSVVDLLGRAGDFLRMEHLWIRLQVQPDIATWLCLLRACQTHGNVSLGKWAFDHVVLLQHKEPSAYVLMSNIYADAGLWDDMCQVEKVRHMEGV